MKALTIFLGLAKVIGIILLIVLTLLLLIIGLVLFCNIKLNLIANNKEENYYKIKITYLLGIVSYTLDNKENNNVVKIFGFKINNKKQKLKNIEKGQEETFKEDENIEIEQKQVHIGEKDISIEVLKKEISLDIEEDDISKEEPTLKEPKEYVKKENLDNNKSKKKKPKKEKKEKEDKKALKEKWAEISPKIKYIKEYKDKKYILQEALKMIKKMLKAVKFKKLYADLEYGLDDPFKTGNICAIISIIMPFFKKKDINIIPNFEESIFLADVNIKCQVKIFNLLAPIVIFILKKPVRKIILYLVKEK